MQIFTKTVSGRTLTLEASTQDELKALIERIEGVPADAQRLVVVGGELSEACTVEVHLDVLGAGKKHKKKNYTKPKKIKHKHKAEKLAVLRYYHVDESGKVSKLRKECTHADCGRGVFMANHHDRYYCGKCHLTYHISPEDRKA